MIFYIALILGFLFTFGMGLYVTKFARRLGEQVHRAAGGAFGLRFWVWTYRSIGVFAFAFASLILWMIVASVSSR